MKNRSAGFTMIELILVVAIVAILTAVAFVAVNPAKRLMDSRNANRQGAVKGLSEAIVNYSLENSSFPLGVTGDLKMVGTAANGCAVACGEESTGDDCVNLEGALQKYLEPLPVDPKNGTQEMSGYAVVSLGANAFKIVACYTEGDEGIEVIVK
ncbi:type II secretion system GspH family protein [Patescibacteria group bacterium]|nr:type II secretion system GspH family protein [Patescibacteria group bacterium]